MSRLTQTFTPSARPGLPCSVGTIHTDLNTTDPESAADLQRWADGNLTIAGQPVNDAQMAAMLTGLGYQPSRQQLGTHRRRQCRCFQQEATAA